MPAPHRQSTAPFSAERVLLGEQTCYRPVRSYVLRQGRLTAAQAQALDRHWAEYGIDYSPVPLDLHQVYGRSAPKILDIGSGMGAVTISLALEHPENDYLAVEVHRPGVGRLIGQAHSANIRNIRIICHDVMDVLEHQLTVRCLDEVYIFFPDPWPKKRHHKRRLIKPGFITLLATRLKTHARIFIATDWRDMAAQILNICDAEPGLTNLAGRGYYSPRPQWRPMTKFEQRGHDLDHQVWDLDYAVDISGLNRPSKEVIAVNSALSRAGR